MIDSGQFDGAGDQRICRQHGRRVGNVGLNLFTDQERGSAKGFKCCLGV